MSLSLAQSRLWKWLWHHVIRYSCTDYIRHIKPTQSLKRISPAFHQIVSRGNGNIQLVFFQEIKKHQDVALLDQRGKCGLVGEKGKHGVRFTEGTSQKTQVTIEESSWDICVQLQPEVSANITRQATEDKTNGLWSAGDQGSLRLCLGSAAHLRLQLVALQLESGLHFGSSGGSDISVGVVQ